MAKRSFTIGCDPEFFLKERESGKLISAIPFVEGTKHEPQPLPKGGNIQRDNVAVEVATDPADSADGFVQNIKNCLTEAVNVLPEGAEIVALPSANFDADQLEHEEAQQFGCDPDFDAWDVSMNESPCATDASFRSCGAHIHVGTNGKDGNEFLLEFDGKIDTIRAMDCVHGIISTILDNSEDAIARRQLYGKPGAHRPKDEYGVEYRVLSNYWLKSPVTVMMMYHLTQDVLDIVRDGKAAALADEIGADRVKDVITTGNSEEAMKIFEQNLIGRLSEDSVHYFNEALAKVKANDMDFHTEWGLYGKEMKA
jgi:hypothetical protein